MITYEALIAAQYNGREELIPENLLCLDPGNETGYYIFEKGKFVEGGQIITCMDKGGVRGASCTIKWDEIFMLLGARDWDAIVVENYRVYGHKLDRHTFSEIPTLRLIGGIDAFCSTQSIPLFYQMATQAKGFVTDDKLAFWGCKFKHEFRHSADALRHGIYFLVVTNLTHSPVGELRGKL